MCKYIWAFRAKLCKCNYHMPHFKLHGKQIVVAEWELSRFDCCPK